MTRALAAALIALALGAAGCEEKAPAPAPTAADPKVAPPVTSGAPTTPGTPTASGTPPAALADEDVPVAEDFIDEAAAEVTADNYKAKLADLQKELARPDE